jgi:glucan phosphoethanolaminetransferase (alkaline phosphatase superfamily)
MSFIPSDGKRASISWILPWLHFLAALVVVVLNALFSAVHSPLGHEISAGESPGFGWIRVHITTFLGVGLGYLVIESWLQLQQMRPSSILKTRLLPAVICLQILCIASIALLVFFQRSEMMPWVFTVLLISILIQMVMAFRPADLPDFDPSALMIRIPTATAGVFLFLLFLLGAVISFLDPSWQRLADQIILDSQFESQLSTIFPALLSGSTSVWLGIGMVILITVASRLFLRLFVIQSEKWLISFLIFFTLVATFSALLFTALYYAIAWQINSLQLKATVWQLSIFLSVCGGLIFSHVFYRILLRIPESRPSSLIGMVSLTLAAAIQFPVTWVLTMGRFTRTCWTLLLLSTLLSCTLIAYVVLFGDLFNPWFTTFSYLKGSILKILCLAVGGIILLLIEQHFSAKSVASSNFRQLGVALALSTVLCFLPFYALGRYPEVKVGVLQFNELTRVDATFAREFAGILGLDKWIHLGQRPRQNNSPHPWPQPWVLNKSHPSLLPEDFNLLVIVVDALRGDAFHSAGYHRNLTPFLDRWAAEEAISFRRAYSQGGGSFAAFPFLVGGRSRFELYGPGLYQQNLYFKLAQAEGIENYMLMKGFGPRDIFPPDLPVIELAIPRAVSDRRSATADEVFESAQNTIGALPTGERFLCFLHLMDVHNDLYKKEDGIDFGDRPKDLYDNNLSYLDRSFSRFVRWLKENGIYNRTVILFTSDHGEQFWEHGASLHGHTVYEEEIRIPLILVTHRGAKRFEDVPVIAADMAPTMAELAGYSINPPYEDPHMGISLLPLIQGNNRQQFLKRDVVGRASFKRRYFLYRNWEWKLVYLAELDLLQLFNVVKDPLEKQNLIAEEPELAADLEETLLGYLRRIEGRHYRSTLAQP